MKKRTEIILFVLGLAIIILAGLNSSRFFTRLDLTASKAFSISSVSKKLFREIPEQVYLTYYISDKLRKLYSFPAQIEDLLLEYAAYSHGKIRVEVLDPLRDAEMTRAESLGVYPQQIEVVERDQRSLAQVYTGIVVQYLDRHETIPVAARVDSLEYELTSRIRKVVSNEQQVVGILLGDQGRNLQQEFSGLYRALSQDFRLEQVSAGQDIPADMDVLLILGNQDLEEFDLFPVDQYIMKGGRVMFAVEGVRVDLQRGLAVAKLEKDPTLDLLEAYGVRVKRELVLDKYCQNFRMPIQMFGQVMWQLLDKYPYWITVAGQYVSRDNPITARFSGLDLYWASPLESTAKAGTEAEVLARTTPEGWTVSQEPFQTNPQQGSLLLAMPHDNKGSYPLAISLRGELTSYFKGRSIPTREGEKRDWQSIVESAKDSRIIVVGDADFASDLLQFTEANYNLDFLSNAAQWLGNSEDLLSIKTRTTRDTRLNKIQDPARRVRSALTAELVNVVLIPLAVIGFGIGRLLYRRKKSVARVEEV
jgi:gliding-associated putative ABC transporter substrate-binding component GldG